MPRERVVGVMSHLATADEADEAFARADRALPRDRHAFPGVTRTWRTAPAPCGSPRRASTPSAGVALYGLSPFGDDPRPTGSSRRSAGGATSRSCASSTRARAPAAAAASSRRAGARRHRPRGVADGFRRGLTGTEVLVDGARRRVVGTVSMDAFAVELEGEQAGAGDVDRRRDPRGGPCPRARNDQLRAHVRPEPRTHPGRRSVVDG